MAYKFFQGTFKTDGILDVNNALTGNSLLVDTGGISVTNGNIVATTSQLTASTVSASSAQFGTITVATLSAPNLDLSGYLDVKGATRLSGTVALGNDAADTITANGQLTASQGLSSSLGIQVGAGGLFAGTLTVNGAAASTFANRVNVGKDGGGLSLSGSGQLQIAGVKNYDQDLRSINQKIVVRDGADANDKAFLDASGQVSGSGQLNIGGTGAVAGNFTVNGAQTTVQQLTASQSSLGVARATSLSASGDVTVGGNFQVNGTTTYVNSTNLTVTDKKVVIATGSANATAADGAGIYIGMDDGTEYANLSYDGTNDRWNMKSVTGLHLSGTNQNLLMNGVTVLQETALFGGAVTGSSNGVSFRLSVTNVTSTPFTPAFSSYVLAVDTTSAKTINLPAPGAGDVGKVFLIKDASNNASVNNITVAPNGTDTIDGVNASFPLSSNGAAVHCVVLAANKWGLF